VRPASRAAPWLRAMTEDFAEKYCQHYKIPPPHFRADLLRRTLYPASRWLRPFLILLDRDYFAADLSYVESVGRLRRLRDLVTESNEFTHHPDNRRFLRQTLRLRISVGRMQDIVHQVMNDVVAR
jgi:hypothetical protein